LIFLKVGCSTIVVY